MTSVELGLGCVYVNAIHVIFLNTASSDIQFLLRNAAKNTIIALESSISNDI